MSVKENCATTRIVTYNIYIFILTFVMTGAPVGINQKLELKRTWEEGLG